MKRDIQKAKDRDKGAKPGYRDEWTGLVGIVPKPPSNPYLPPSDLRLKHIGEWPIEKIIEASHHKRAMSIVDSWTERSKDQKKYGTKPIAPTKESSAIALSHWFKCVLQEAKNCRRFGGAPRTAKMDDAYAVALEEVKVASALMSDYFDVEAAIAANVIPERDAVTSGFSIQCEQAYCFLAQLFVLRAALDRFAVYLGVPLRKTK